MAEAKEAGMRKTALVALGLVILVALPALAEQRVVLFEDLTNAA
jgi:hypothetical protein